jgi:hypothetical protein
VQLWWCMCVVCLLVMLITGLRRQADCCQCSNGTRCFLELCCISVVGVMACFGQLEGWADPADVPISLA